MNRRQQGRSFPYRRDLDRRAVAKRPDRLPAGSQRWRNLLFMHWPVDGDELRNLVPEQLQLDPYDGIHWVGVVPFRMHQIRPRWLPPFLALDFLECNVRTYVIYEDKPGVYFFSLDASSRLAVWAARLGWSLPYYYAEMSESMPAGQIHYCVDRDETAGLDVTYRVTSDLGPSEPGSPEYFFLERYLLFSLRDGVVRCGQVHHCPYPVYGAELLSVDETLIAAADLPDTIDPPPFVHWSPGVDVEVYGLR